MISEDRIDRAVTFLKSVGHEDEALLLHQVRQQRNAAAGDALMWQQMVMLDIKIIQGAAAVLVAVSEQQDASAREFEIGLFVMLVVLFALGVVLFVLAILAAFTLGCHNGIHWPPWLAGGIVVVLLLYLIGRWLRT